MKFTSCWSEAPEMGSFCVDGGEALAKAERAEGVDHQDP